MCNHSADAKYGELIKILIFGQYQAVFCSQYKISR